jgi:hypothetical protein
MPWDDCDDLAYLFFIRNNEDPIRPCHDQKIVLTLQCDSVKIKQNFGGNYNESTTLL